MHRRVFLTTAAATAANLIAQRATRYDILIKNGNLRDPSTKLSRQGDLAIQDGKIAAIAADIPATQGIDTIDATGLYVIPGLVDLHTHCFYGGSGLGIEADPIAAK